MPGAPVMSDPPLVLADRVSKKFCKSLTRSLWYGVVDTLRETAGRAGDGRLRDDEFWAVRDVSFSVRRGECLGLIGHNGAGKSTLLKMLSGLIKPDGGRIEIRGRVGSLIELGAGFNPILTGRENIHSKGAVLGLTPAEIRSRFDAIVEFAEIGDFIDMPVQNYSSGMKVRLGFAVSAQIEPDVLLIDEVLAVGDVRFQFKCLNALAGIIRRAAVIFVSHSMPQIFRVASQVLLLERGQTRYQGANVGEGVEQYFRMIDEGAPCVSGTGAAVLERLTLESGGRTAVAPEALPVAHGADLRLRLRLRLAPGLGPVRVQVVVWNHELHAVMDVIGPDSAGFLLAPDPTGVHELEAVIPKLMLNGGRHTLTVVVTEPDASVVHCRHDNAGIVGMGVHFLSGANLIVPAEWRRVRPGD